MRHAGNVKPVAFVAANAADALDVVTSTRQPLIITQDGKARAVLQDIASYEETQETLALLKLLALGERDVAEGKTRTVDEVFADIRAARG